MQGKCFGRSFGWRKSLKVVIYFVIDAKKFGEAKSGLRNGMLSYHSSEEFGMMKSNNGYRRELLKPGGMLEIKKDKQIKQQH